MLYSIQDSCLKGVILLGIFLTLAFLFFIGSVFGWVLELFFRRFISANNPERKWINPGFCVGPYLPLYGSGLCILFLIASLERFNIFENPVTAKIVLFICMAVCMTAIEYIAGIISLKLTTVRLWDYSKEWGNIQGIICPKFSFFWAVLGALYYFLVHPHILSALYWLSNNLAFSFFIGLFYGVFVIDVVYSSNLIYKLKKFADEYQVVVRYEELKAQLQAARERANEKQHFFLFMRSEKPLYEHLKEMREQLETKAKKYKKK